MQSVQAPRASRMPLAHSDKPMRYFHEIKLNLLYPFDRLTRTRNKSHDISRRLTNLTLIQTPTPTAVSVADLRFLLREPRISKTDQLRFLLIS